MNHWYRRVFLLVVVAFALMIAAGCGDKRQKITVREEQHEGEVVEEQPGEMIVE
jgi:hypothetical protein